MDALQSHHAPKPAAKQREAVRREPIAWRRLLATTALFSVATGAILLALDSHQPEPQATAPVEVAAGNQSPLGLKVTNRKQQMEIRWDHDSVAVLKPGKGLMKITEGQTTKSIALDWRDLQDGSVSYTPLTSDVQIRLEITGVDGATSSESARVVAIP